MMKFSELMATNPPRFVVTYHVVDGREQFGWTVVGTVQALTMLGRLARVGAQLVTGQLGDLCDDSALVVLLGPDERRWFLSRDVPVDPLVGMLEKIKVEMVANLAAQQAPRTQARRGNSGIVGPDGSPFRFG